MIKELFFGFWAALWVAIDDLGKYIGDMSLKDFAKLTGKIVLYGLSVIGWVLILSAMWVLL